MEARPASHALNVLAREVRADLSVRLAASAWPAPFVVGRAGADGWFIAGEALLGAGEIARRGVEIVDIGWLLDQAHGRSRLVLAGPKSAMRLSRGIGADLSLRGFAVGAAGETQSADIGLHLARTAPDCFKLLVGRSFAESQGRKLEA